MKRKEEADLLTLYTDHLLGLVNETPGSGPPVSTRHTQVHRLLTLADHLHAILAPVKPDPRFRRQLHGRLILEAQNRAIVPAVDLLPPDRHEHRTRRVIGAAVGLGSVASVVGVIIAVLWRRRTGQAAAG